MHCSQETAELLIAAGKHSWVVPRENTIIVKGRLDFCVKLYNSSLFLTNQLVSGKGEMQTYWIEVNPNKKLSSRGSSTFDNSYLEDDLTDFAVHFDEKKERLIDFAVTTLIPFLAAIVGRRKKFEGGGTLLPPLSSLAKYTTVPLEEVEQIIEFPKIDSPTLYQNHVTKDVELDWNVVHQLKAFVASIASMYRDNPFHNCKGKLICFIRIVDI